MRDLPGAAARRMRRLQREGPSYFGLGPGSASSRALSSRWGRQSPVDTMVSATPSS